MEALKQEKIEKSRKKEEPTSTVTELVTKIMIKYPGEEIDSGQSIDNITITPTPSSITTISTTDTTVEIGMITITGEMKWMHCIIAVFQSLISVFYLW